MSRGQAQIFAEFLGFAIGLVVVISIAFIFSNYLSPEIVNEALDHHMDNILKQVELAASQLLYYSDYFGDKTMTLKLNFPTKLNRYTYEIYKFNEKLCVSVTGTENMKCVDNAYNIKGAFVSGTRFLLDLEREQGKVTLTMGAD